MVIARDRGEERMGSYYIVDVELQSYTILSNNIHVLNAT